MNRIRDVALMVGFVVLAFCLVSNAMPQMDFDSPQEVAITAEDCGGGIDLAMIVAAIPAEAEESALRSCGFTDTYNTLTARNVMIDDAEFSNVYGQRRVKAPMNAYTSGFL